MRHRPRPAGRSRPGARPTRQAGHQPVGNPSDRGSMSVEMAALVWPVTVIMAVLLIGVWRLSMADLETHTAAAAAARAASLADRPATAEVAAEQTALAALAAAGLVCQELTVEVDTSQFTHGGTVSVQVACQIPTGDLIGLGGPGTVTTMAAALAPIEQHRQLQVDQP